MQATNEDRLQRRPITATEFLRMEKLGILGGKEQIELLDGRLFTLPPIGPKGAVAANMLSRVLHERIADRALIAPQHRIALDALSVAQPNLMLTALPPERYWNSLPTPADALLVVEVARGTPAFERGQKMRVYARCGVGEYWIVDLVHGRIEVYRNPRGQRYSKHATFGRGETPAPEAFPDALVPVGEILPPER
jgi:Uma2 family endonuclease